ncbi:MAG: ABC transporter transmembrane domain-containing protein [Bdellovibrio sp.]
MKSLFELSLTKLFWEQFKRYWGYYISAAASLYATHWILSQLPGMARDLAEMIQGKNISVSPWLFLISALAIIAFRTSSRWLFFYPARILERDLREEMVKCLEGVSPSRFFSRGRGQIYQVLSNDLENVRALIGFAVLQLANMFIAMAVLIPKVLEGAPGLLIAFSPMLITFLIFTLVAAKNRHNFRFAQDMQGEVQNFIMETYNGKKTIRNFHAEKSFVQNFAKVSNNELFKVFEASNRIAFSIPLIPLGIGLSLIWGAFLINRDQLGASMLIWFSGFVFLFLEPMMFVSWIGMVFARSWGAWKRMCELYAQTISPSPFEVSLRQDNQSGTTSVTTRLWNNQLSVEWIQQGWFAFAGNTGCGKTTLMNQMVEWGRIEGKRLSYVAQEPYVYNDTFGANILLGRTATPEDLSFLKEMVELFGLSELNRDFESLLAMELGENGVRLSGGQSKRMALIRSLLCEAEYLFWDDPFSSVDLILERDIIRKLRAHPIVSKKVIYLTTHRLSTLRYCDTVLLLGDQGEVLESGRVNELLKEGTQTYEHFEKQMV